MNVFRIIYIILLAHISDWCRIYYMYYDSTIYNPVSSLQYQSYSSF